MTMDEKRSMCEEPHVYLQNHWIEFREKVRAFELHHVANEIIQILNIVKYNDNYFLN